MRESLVKVGQVFVDAGIIWVGDPCYVMSPESSHGPKTWDEFCGLTFDKQHEIKVPGVDDARIPTIPLGDGIGICFPTVYGDGSYPVYGVIKDGAIHQIRIDISGEYDEEDDEDCL
jgi:hypothetical protein